MPTDGVDGMNRVLRGPSIGFVRDYVRCTSLKGMKSLGLYWGESSDERGL